MTQLLAHWQRGDVEARELFLRLSASAQLTVDNRMHFFALAARTMRRILIDHARARV